MLTKSLEAKWVVPAVALVATAVASYLAVTGSATLILGLLALGALVASAASFPRLSLTLWVAATIFIPSWTPIGLAGFTPGPSAVIGIPVLLGLTFSRYWARKRLSGIDAAVAFGMLLVGIFVGFGQLPQFLLVNLVLVAGIAYVLGRAADDGIQTQFARIMVVIAVWGIVEFVTGWHPFTEWFPASTHHWNDVQIRGGLTRSEASLGHAIAYGACLSMAIPFARNLPKRPGLAQVVLVVAIIASLSRGPLLAMVFTLGLCALVLATGVKRVRALLLTAVGVGVVFLVFDVLYSGEFAEEVDASGNARLTQLDSTFSLINLLGPAQGFGLTDSNTVAVSGVAVVDSTFLRLALNYGWVVALLLLAPLFYALIGFARGKAGPATIALIGQLPVILVTSFIVQWQAIFFFVAGMAVTELQRRYGQGQERKPPVNAKPKLMHSPAGLTRR
jgi:hypothetical protein